MQLTPLHNAGSSLYLQSVDLSIGMQWPPFLMHLFPLQRRFSFPFDILRSIKINLNIWKVLWFEDKELRVFYRYHKKNENWASDNQIAKPDQNFMLYDMKF